MLEKVRRCEVEGRQWPCVFVCSYYNLCCDSYSEEIDAEMLANIYDYISSY